MFSALITVVLRLILGAVTVILVLGLMALALATFLGLSLWALIRGRRPTVDLSGFARARSFRAGAGFGTPRAQGGKGGRMNPADVVDIEAREISGAGEGGTSRPALPPQQP